MPQANRFPEVIVAALATASSIAAATTYPAAVGELAFTTDTKELHVAASLVPPGFIRVSTPTGAILLWPAAAAPSEYLLCNGAAVSRATYANLFAIIGTTFGAGDGVTTFNLPDLRGRFPLGQAAAGTGSALGAVGGSIDHTHPFTQPAAHSDHVVTQPAAHSNHAVTQPAAHSDHVVTQPATHSGSLTHDSLGGHTHDAHTSTVSTSLGSGATKLTAPTGAHSTDGAHAHAAHTLSEAHSGAAVDAHSAHSGAAVDAHSAHSGAAVDAHSAHSGGAVQSQNPPFIALNFIIKT